MANKIKIGFPRAFLYYHYKYLWEAFFKELGCEIIVSPETNKKILKDGIDSSIDECCLSSKIYMGHIKWLIGKADYILIPRIASYSKKDDVCTKFNAMYDIVKSTFNDVDVLDYNIDVKRRRSEFMAFMKMGSILKKKKVIILKAYLKAKKENRKQEKLESSKQELIIKTTDKLKILIVSHPYNTYDKLLGQSVINYLKSLNVEPIYSDKVDKKISSEKSKVISKTLYWIYNKRLIGSIEYYKDKIDGILFLSTFPCGPDSLVTELCLRKIKNIPMTNIVLDELQGEAGLQTRIESFIDIINEKKKILEKS